MSITSPNVFFQRLLGCCAAFVLVATFDYLTGYEVSMSPMYIFPVGLAFFNFGTVGGYIAAVLSAVCWSLIDKWNGHQFSQEVLRWETGFSRFVVYALSVWALSVYRETVSTHQARLEALQRLIPMCSECGRIRTADGQWRSPEELLALAPPAPLECPDCGAHKDSPRA